MSFIQRELDKINEAIRFILNSDEHDEQRDKKSDLNRLYAAQQTLSWALEPTVICSPFNTIMSINDDRSNGLAGATLDEPVELI